MEGLAVAHRHARRGCRWLAGWLAESWSLGLGEWAARALSSARGCAIIPFGGGAPDLPSAHPPPMGLWGAGLTLKEGQGKPVPTPTPGSPIPLEPWGG